MMNVNKITSSLSMMPDTALQQFASLNKNDPYMLSLAVAESNRRKELRGAMQAQGGKAPPVADQAIAEMAPQQPIAGIAALPTGDVARMAGGGVVAFADGGPAYEMIPTDGYPPAPAPLPEEDDRPQFLRDLAAIPGMYEAWWQRNRAEDARKAAGEKTSADRQAALDAARQKGSFANYLFGSPQRAAEGKAELAELAKPAPASARAPLGVAGPDTGDETARLLARYPRPKASPGRQGKEGSVSVSTASGARTRGKQAGLPALAVEEAAAPAAKTPSFEEISAAVQAEAGKRNADTDKAFDPYERLHREEAERLSGKKDANVKEALIRAGLGMLAGTSPHAMVNIGQGGIQGLESFQQAQKADDEARRHNMNAQVLLMQAKRAERSGNMRDATSLYGQYRQEVYQAGALAQQARQLAEIARHNRATEGIQQQLANQQGAYQRGMIGVRVGGTDLKTLQAQQRALQAQISAIDKNPLALADPEQIALRQQLQNQLQAVTLGIAQQPGGVTMDATAAPSSAGWGKATVVKP